VELGYAEVYRRVAHERELPAGTHHGLHIRLLILSFMFRVCPFSLLPWCVPTAGLDTSETSDYYCLAGGYVLSYISVKGFPP
jgi:hypothetical protein